MSATIPDEEAQAEIEIGRMNPTPARGKPSSEGCWGAGGGNREVVAPGLGRGRAVGLIGPSLLSSRLRPEQQGAISPASPVSH